MSKPTTIDGYHETLADPDRAIADALRATITTHLPEAEAKMWHAHPVWFLDGNPITGYSKLKSCMRLFFWSGQGFPTPGLTPSGTFKAAEARFTDASQIDHVLMAQWISNARDIQWDYQNIYKTKGRLDRLIWPSDLPN